MSVQASALDDLSSPISRSEGAFVRVLLALLCASLSTFGLLYCVQPLLPMFAAEFQLGAAEASLAVSAATMALAVGLQFASALSDRWGRKPVMTGALYAAALLTVLAAAAPNWPLLVLLRALAGLVLAGRRPWPWRMSPTSSTPTLRGLRWAFISPAQRLAGCWGGWAAARWTMSLDGVEPWPLWDWPAASRPASSSGASRRAAGIVPLAQRA